MKTKQLTIICVFLIICMFASENNFNKPNQNFDILNHSTFDSTLPPMRLSIPQLEAYDASHDILKVQEQSPHISPSKNGKDITGDVSAKDDYDFQIIEPSDFVLELDEGNSSITLDIEAAMKMPKTQKVTLCGHGTCIDVEVPSDFGKNTFTP